jgi:lysophospholipase L1-like esterase
MKPFIACSGRAGHILAEPLLFIFVSMLHVEANAQDRYSVSVAGTKSTDTRIVVIGASYAKDWKILKVGNYRVVNKGVEGNQTHEMLARFDVDVIRERPASVLVWGFINDIFRSSRDELPAKLEKTKANLLAMLRKAKSAGIRPILATELTITTPDTIREIMMATIGKLRGKQGYQDYINQHVRSMNIWIRTVASEQKILLLDFEKVLSAETGERMRKYASSDGSHLSEEAYMALTSHIQGVALNMPAVTGR